MPAISPSKLKQQSARLAETYTQPGIFVREMHAMLTLYADKTHRPGKSGASTFLLDGYNTPPPVLRQIRLTLKPIAEKDPLNILALCDRLWQESYLEHCQLACILLGSVPLIDPSHICQRLEDWSRTTKQEQLLRFLVDDGMTMLRRGTPTAVVDLSEKWLTDPDTNLQRLGLQALIPLVADANFQNLPAVFHILSPLLKILPSRLRPDMIVLLTHLAHQSPTETAYTLNTALGWSDNPDTAWLTRQVINEFPQEIQKSLRQTLRQSTVV